jgi:hypothetical protein
VGLKRGPLSLVSTNEELLGRKNSGSGLEKREYSCRDITLTMWLPLSAKVGTNFEDKQRSLGRYTSFTDSDHRVCFISVVCLCCEMFTGDKLVLSWLHMNISHDIQMNGQLHANDILSLSSHWIGG